jgi:hypothetical protein
MRKCVLALATAAALAAAAPAFAQMMTAAPQGFSAPVPYDNGSYSFSDHPPVSSAQARYNAQVVALKAKMRQLTRVDGGQLSDEHKARLQGQLDELNRSFGIKPAHG